MPNFPADDHQPELVPEQDACSFYDPECLGSWIQEQLTTFALWLFEKFLGGMAAIIEAIPVPDFLTDIGSLTIPPSVAWAASAFELQSGMAIIVTAYGLRFIIRRLPIVG